MTKPTKNNLLRKQHQQLQNNFLPHIADDNMKRKQSKNKISDLNIK